jgi:hypothetical protein
MGEWSTELMDEWNYRLMSTMYKSARKKIKIRKLVSKVRRRVLYAQYRQLLLTPDFYVPRMIILSQR